jgi:hypothetical protein
MAPKQIITFQLEGVIMKNDTERLKHHSSYFRDALQNIPNSNVTIILPTWVSKMSLSIFLKFINEDMLPKNMDANEALKVLWISDYFKVNELIEI